ncbi:MAG: LemA family protein [Thermodesulfovibrio sp.]|uniref:LemA family protein n=1 Tax=unclassified Thermodesulfovibrio TaxID=2645936 RepID=UPI00083AE438|nr:MULTISPECIES: LemA family protein [unclassified Thermodesulfovibrio]MDI1471980.1 LemA family protein [Thermodesulfovibrio sp. 1176]MDI6715004.1 LemA family protein [Thermodesulfovibrio sp.]
MLYLIPLIIFILVLLWLIFTYNKLVRLKIMTEQAWSDVDVQLKRRHDLIPNLVETVKGYATHERKTLEEVVKIRNTAISAKTTEEKIEAENMLTQALRQLFALAENYPDLKASVNFQALQNELAKIEETISMARRYFNAVVRDYNTSISIFPNSLIAGILGFTRKIFFEMDETERVVPQVKF